MERTCLVFHKFLRTENSLRRTTLAVRAFVLPFVMMLGFSRTRAIQNSLGDDYPVLKRSYHFQVYNTDQGLSSNGCQETLIDQFGFLWVATNDGLNRFDGMGFTVYRNIPNDTTSLSGNHIWAMFSDSFGALWVGTYGNGLNHFDRALDRFYQYRSNPNDATTLDDNTIFKILEDRKSRIWILTSEGLNLLVGRGSRDELQRNKLRFLRHPHIPEIRRFKKLISFREDSVGNLWIITNQGTEVFDPDSSRFTKLDRDPIIPKPLRKKTITGYLFDKAGSLWIGTTEGVFRYWKESDSLQQIKLIANNIGNSTNFRFYEDQKGIVWITTLDAGMYQFDSQRGITVHHCYQKDDPHSFPTTMVRELFAEDGAGNLWIPTGAGLAKLSRHARQFKHLIAEVKIEDSFGLLEASDGTLWIRGELGFRRGSIQEKGDYHVNLKRPAERMYEDKQGTVWVGTWGGGLNLIDVRSGSVTSFKRNPSSQSRDRDNWVTSIAEGADGVLWLGTWEAGLCRFDTRTKRYSAQHVHDPRNAQSISHDRVWALLRDRNGMIWSGTEGGGINRFDTTTGIFTSWKHDPRNKESISDDLVYALHQDDNGILWIGTKNGVCRFDKTTGKFQQFFRGRGQLSNTVRVIVTDKQGRVWIGYNTGGMAVLNPMTETIISFSTNDGLPSNAFMNGEGYCRPTGEVVMGTDAGILAFYPDSILVNMKPLPIVITSFSVLDHRRPFLDAMKNSLPIVLSFNENSFSIEFASLDFTDAKQNQFGYMLTNFDNEWATTDRREVRYTNIPSGEYIFHVKGTNNGRGIWNDIGVSLHILVLPPWYRTWWAYLLYGALAFGALFMYRRSELKKIALKNESKIAQAEAMKMKQVDEMKSRFFANISHEFRTPLTLILGPIQKWKERSVERLSRVAPASSETGVSRNESGELRSDMAMAERNAHRLLRLINQLLDLSKFDAGNMELQLERLDIAELVREVASSFDSLSEAKGIEFEINVDHQPLVGMFDRDKVEKIVTNLLSNAFKFTKNGGRVSIQLAPSEPQTPNLIVISVQDAGIGIAPDKLDKIFDRFYQVNDESTRDYEGTGIGLALTKEFVEHHGGTLSVESQVGKGTTFTVMLPFDKKPTESSATSHQIQKSELRGSGSSATMKALDSTIQKPESNAPIVLVVEDNADMRSYVKSVLSAGFRMHEAKDGEEGITRAHEIIPDLIICDVMMPKKDGFHVSKALKQDEKTSHIPIIMLTAKAAMENKLEGLELGADDYLAKPFEPKELLARARNLIKLRQKLREKFSVAQPLKPGEIAVPSLDDAFLQKVKAVVERKMEDENFGVEELASEVAMSRMQLHRKLTALTNQSASEFMRYLRLHRAKQLLEHNGGTVSEIAYSVGFGSPAHFAKCFKEQFGIAPSELRSS